MLPAAAKMKKKALAMPTIILLIIGIVVLAIMVSIFAGKANIFGETAESCSAKGGQCMLPAECDGIKSYYKCEEKEICCLRG